MDFPSRKILLIGSTAGVGLTRSCREPMIAVQARSDQGRWPALNWIERMHTRDEIRLTTLARCAG